MCALLSRPPHLNFATPGVTMHRLNLLAWTMTCAKRLPAQRVSGSLIGIGQAGDLPSPLTVRQCRKPLRQNSVAQMPQHRDTHARKRLTKILCEGRESGTSTVPNVRAGVEHPPRPVLPLEPFSADLARKF